MKSIVEKLNVVTNPMGQEITAVEIIAELLDNQLHRNGEEQHIKQSAKFFIELVNAYEEITEERLT